MTVTTTAGTAGPGQAVVEAALVLLERMGLAPEDLVAVPRQRPVLPTFAEYVPVVSAAVTAGTRRAYGSYWNRVLEHWGGCRLDKPTPSEVRQLMAYVKTHVVTRRNARGGRSAAKQLVAALRCLYRHAEDDGLIAEADNPGPQGRQAAPPALDPPGRSRRPAGRDQPDRRRNRQRSRARHDPAPGCTPRRAAAGAAPWPCDRGTSTPTSA